jgi:hypothetical protein
VLALAKPEPKLPTFVTIGVIAVSLNVFLAVPVNKSSVIT